MIQSGLMTYESKVEELTELVKMAELGKIEVTLNATDGKGRPVAYEVGKEESNSDGFMFLEIATKNMLKKVLAQYEERVKELKKEFEKL